LARREELTEALEANPLYGLLYELERVLAFVSQQLDHNFNPEVQSVEPHVTAGTGAEPEGLTAAALRYPESLPAEQAPVPSDGDVSDLPVEVVLSSAASAPDLPMPVEVKTEPRRERIAERIASLKLTGMLPVSGEVTHPSQAPSVTEETAQEAAIKSAAAITPVAAVEAAAMSILASLSAVSAAPGAANPAALVPETMPIADPGEERLAAGGEVASDGIDIANGAEPDIADEAAGPAEEPISSTTALDIPAAEISPAEHEILTNAEPLTIEVNSTIASNVEEPDPVFELARDEILTESTAALDFDGGEYSGDDFEEAEVSIVPRASTPEPPVSEHAATAVAAGHDEDDSDAGPHETLEQRLQRLDRQSERLIAPPSTSKSALQQPEAGPAPQTWLEIMRARRASAARAAETAAMAAAAETVTWSQAPIEEPPLPQGLSKPFPPVSDAGPISGPPLTLRSYDGDGGFEAEVSIVQKRPAVRNADAFAGRSAPARDRLSKALRPRIGVASRDESSGVLANFAALQEEASVEIVRQPASRRSVQQPPSEMPPETSSEQLQGTQHETAKPEPDASRFFKALTGD